MKIQIYPRHTKFSNNKRSKNKKFGECLVKFYGDLVNLIGSKEIFIEKYENVFRFRASTIDDYKTLKISICKDNITIISYYAPESEELVGSYELDQDGDWFYLEKIEANQN